MQVALKPHPQTPPQPVWAIDVRLEREGAILWLRFTVDGEVNELEWPLEQPHGRSDELWKHTCFEVFLRAPGANTYYEFNLAPSSQWAAYAFAAYRERAPDPDTPAPFIDAEGGRTRFELRAALDVAHLGLPADGPWRAGLSAVLEADDGTRAFWALAHPPGQPDFHHADAFALSLPPPKA